MTKIPSAILGFGLAGVLGAAVAVLAMNIGAEEIDRIEGGDARAIAQLEQLSARLERIENRMEVMEKAPPMPAGQAVAPAVVIPSAAEDITVLDAGTLSPEIDERVRELVKENQANQMQQTGKRFAAMFKQREAGMLDRLTENNGLSAWQRTEMERLLERRGKVIGEVIRSMFGQEGDGSVDLATIRKKAEDVRKETDLEVKEILTPEQYEAFQADSANRRGGPWGGGGRGR